MGRHAAEAPGRRRDASNGRLTARRGSRREPTGLSPNVRSNNRQEAPLPPGTGDAFAQPVGTAGSANSVLETFVDAERNRALEW